MNFLINIAHAITIDNPLGANTTVADVINRIAGYMYGVAAALSTIMVLIGAFQILTAAGDAVKYKKGKDTIVYTVIGLAIILLAGGVVSLVSGILGTNTNSGIGGSVGGEVGASGSIGSPFGNAGGGIGGSVGGEAGVR